EGAFALDLAGLYLLLHTPQKALEPAERALRLSRLSHSAEGELAAYGTLGLIYRSLGDVSRAETYAVAGVERAAVLGLKTREAAFLGDLGILALQSGSAAKAADFMARGMEAAAQAGALDMWRMYLTQLSGIVAEVSNPEVLGRTLILV